MSPGKLVALQQLAHFEFDQVKQFGIIHRIALVQRNHDVRHSYLARQQHVLARLRHRTIGCRHHQDRAIHLRRARDHVLDVVGVARTIHVRVVTVCRLILHVRGRDRDSARLFFRRVSIESKLRNWIFGLCLDNTFVIAAVNVVFP